jgi:hypothetical protein
MTLLEKSEVIIKEHLDVVRNNADIKVALGRYKDRFIRITICYAHKTIVFTDTITSEQVIKSY